MSNKAYCEKNEVTQQLEVSGAWNVRSLSPLTLGQRIMQRLGQRCASK